MRSTTTALALQRVQILRRIAGAKKILWKNSSLAPPQSSALRCLSSARPLPTIDEITESEWRKEVKALKKSSSQSPLPPSTAGSPPTAKFSSTSPAAKVTDLTDNDNDNEQESSSSSSSYASTNTLTYTGGAAMPVTTKLHIVTPQEDTPQGIWPVFRLMVRKSSVTVTVIDLFDASQATSHELLNGEDCCYCCIAFVSYSFTCAPQCGCFLNRMLLAYCSYHL